MFTHTIGPLNDTFRTQNATFLHLLVLSFFPLTFVSRHKTRRSTMADGHDITPAQKKGPSKKDRNPFASGFVPNGRRKKSSQSYLTKRNLLKHMLEVDITIQDLPIKMAENLRDLLPGWFDNVEKRFTMRQIMELTQFQLLFSKSDYVRQDAINAIKDRVDGKAVQKLQISEVEYDPTEIVLPSGRKIAI